MVCCPVFCFRTIASASILARVISSLYNDESSTYACIGFAFDRRTVAGLSSSGSGLVSTYVNAVVTPPAFRRHFAGWQYGQQHLFKHTVLPTCHSYFEEGSVPFLC